MLKEFAETNNWIIKHVQWFWAGPALAISLVCWLGAEYVYFSDRRREKTAATGGGKNV